MNSPAGTNKPQRERRWRNIGGRAVPLPSCPAGAPYPWDDEAWPMLREEFKEGDGAAAPAPTRWVVELNGTLAPLAALRLETRPRLVALVVKPQDRAVLDDDHVHTDELCDQFSAAIATLAVARFDRRPLAR